MKKIKKKREGISPGPYFIYLVMLIGVSLFIFTGIYLLLSSSVDYDFAGFIILISFFLIFFARSFSEEFDFSLLRLGVRVLLIIIVVFSSAFFIWGMIIGAKDIINGAFLAFLLASSGFLVKEYLFKRKNETPF